MLIFELLNVFLPFWLVISSSGVIGSMFLSPLFQVGVEPMLTLEVTQFSWRSLCYSRVSLCLLPRSLLAWLGLIDVATLGMLLWRSLSLAWSHGDCWLRLTPMDAAPLCMFPWRSLAQAHTFVAAEWRKAGMFCMWVREESLQNWNHFWIIVKNCTVQESVKGGGNLLVYSWDFLE